MANISGGTAAFSVIVNKRELSDVTSISVPDVEFSTTEIKGAGIMGTIAIPTSNSVSAMTTTISLRKTGKDKGFIMAQKTLDIEIRIATDIRTNAGDVIVEGTKIFISGFVTKIAGGKVENSATRDETIDVSVFRYREIVDGVETVLIDVINNIMKFGGKELNSAVRSILR